MNDVVSRTLPARIFKPMDERINLLLPLILLVFIGIEIGMSKTFFSADFLFESFVVDIVFLNITHNAFTYAMILSLPELRPWVESQGDGSEKKFWIRLIALNIGLAAGFFWLFFFGWNAVYMRVLFYLITIVFPVHHALSQSFGLSLIYNKKTEGDIGKIEKQERRLNRIFMGLVLAGVVLVTALLGEFISVEEPWVRMLWIAARILVFSSMLSLLVVMLFYPRRIRWLKALFSLRYIVWSFSLFSPIAIAGTKIIHGLEYAFVTRKMVSNSKGGWSMWLKVGGVLSAVLVILAYFRFTALLSYDRAKELPLWFYGLAAISFAFTYSHYYLDRNLFRMRESVNRETAGKLLTND